MSSAWAELVASVNGRTFFGQSGVRDPDYPCEMFAPGVPSGTTCKTDGHYMCRECVHAPPSCAGCGEGPALCTCPDEVPCAE